MIILLHLAAFSNDCCLEPSLVIYCIRATPHHLATPHGRHTMTKWTYAYLALLAFVAGITILISYGKQVERLPVGQRVTPTWIVCSGIASTENRIPEAQLIAWYEADELRLGNQLSVAIPYKAYGALDDIKDGSLETYERLEKPISVIAPPGAGRLILWIDDPDFSNGFGIHIGGVQWRIIGRTLSDIRMVVFECKPGLVTIEPGEEADHWPPQIRELLFTKDATPGVKQ